jgi:chemotaxis regulatin CheY-phosphate phosphatase CheZ
LNYSFNGTIHNILSEEIKTSINNILKLIKSPKEFIKNTIYNDYSDKTKNIVIKNNFQDLENNLNKIIKEIPNYIKDIEENVIRVEKIYKEEEQQKAVDKEIIFTIKMKKRMIYMIESHES